jgi:TPR repeat protein
MNRLLILPVLLLTLLVGNPAFSADFKKGVIAYQSGDYATALREWEPLAKQGDASMQSLVGSMYNEGKGVPQNDKTAVKWYRLAAEQGYASA